MSSIRFGSGAFGNGSAFVRHSSSQDASNLAHSSGLMGAAQRDAHDRLGVDPQMSPQSIATAQSAAVRAMLPAMRDRMNALEVQDVLDNPAAGIVFMENEVRYRPRGTKAAPMEPAVAAALDALDATMLGGPGMKVVQRMGPDGRPISVLQRTDSAKGPWYVKPSGEAVFHNVRPSEARAAAASFRRAIGRFG